MPTTKELAQFGAAAYAILTFTPGYNADTFTRLTDMADCYGLDVSDRETAREICAEQFVDPSNCGDDTPQFFQNGSFVADQLLNSCLQRWHDSRAQEHASEAHAAEQLIEALLRYTGITLR